MYNEIPRSIQYWIHLLAISTRFEFTRIRQRAISEIDAGQMDPVDKIVLARDHDVPHWLSACYEALCQREEALDVPEAEKLGAKTTALVARARETLRESRPVDHCDGCRCATPNVVPPGRCTPNAVPPGSPSYYGPLEVSRIVRDVFQLDPPGRAPPLRPSSEQDQCLSPLLARWLETQPPPDSKICQDQEACEKAQISLPSATEADGSSGKKKKGKKKITFRKVGA